MNTQRGFTLIELLVVIAIIGVLSSVVLSSLNSARGKGNDAKVKAQLSSARGSAEIYYANNSGYTGMCDVTSTDTTGIYQYLLGTNYPDSVAPTCNVTATAYAIWRTLPFVGGNWCVDSVGASKPEPTGTPASGATVCP